MRSCATCAHLWQTHTQIGFIAALFIDYVGPFYIQLVQFGYRGYCLLPHDILSAIAGIGLSFCGGAYCASVSAIEAFRMCGWDRTRVALQDIYADGCAVYDAHLADEASDADRDGVRDVTQLSANDLLTRKLAVAAMAVKDPEKLSSAVAGLYTSWLAVQAVLRLEFAKRRSRSVRHTSLSAGAAPRHRITPGYRASAPPPRRHTSSPPRRLTTTPPHRIAASPHRHRFVPLPRRLATTPPNRHTPSSPHRTLGYHCVAPTPHRLATTPRHRLHRLHRHTVSPAHQRSVPLPYRHASERHTASPHTLAPHASLAAPPRPQSAYPSCASWLYPPLPPQA